MATFVSAIFHDRAHAENAGDALVRAGFRRDDISLLLSADAQARHFGVTTGSRAGEGAAIGATTGGAIGALVMGLAAVGSIAVPGVGLLAAGPLVAALAGAGAGGATGSLVGALVGSGIPEHEAELYGSRIEQGALLVGVHVHDVGEEGSARQTLVNAGGESLSAA
jgi:hypothetical protein